MIKKLNKNNYSESIISLISFVLGAFLASSSIGLYLFLTK